MLTYSSLSIAKVDFSKLKMLRHLQQLKLRGTNGLSMRTFSFGGGFSALASLSKLSILVSNSQITLLSLLSQIIMSYVATNVTCKRSLMLTTEPDVVARCRGGAIQVSLESFRPLRSRDW